LREDRWRPSCPRSQGDEDGLLTRHCAVDRLGIEDVSLNDSRRAAGEVQPTRVANKGCDFMTLGDSSFDQ